MNTLQDPIQSISAAFYAIAKSIGHPPDLYKVSRSICDGLRGLYHADGCELKLLESDNSFNRICFSVDEQVANFSMYEERLDSCRSHLNDSLYGELLKTNKTFYWHATDTETFTDFVAHNHSPINRTAALVYADMFATSAIQNFVVIPMLPLHSVDTPAAPEGGCLALFNVHDATRDADVLVQCLLELEELFGLLAAHIRAAVSLQRASAEAEINESIDRLSQTETLDDLLQSAITILAQRSASPLASIWLHDQNNSLLTLHYVHIQPPFPSGASEDVIRAELNSVPHILRCTDSVIGCLATDSSMQFVKRDSVDKDAKDGHYKWAPLLRHLGLRTMLAIPVRDGAQLIAVIALHPHMSTGQFERLSLSYYRSFCAQLLLPLKHLEQKTFVQSTITMHAKLRAILRRKPHRFFAELVEKVQSVIGAEACSLFQVRPQSGGEPGLYLLATTDRSREAKQRVGTHIYGLDDSSLTGRVARRGTPLIVYDVTAVDQYYPELKMSRAFLEVTESGSHRSYVAIAVEPEGHPVTGSDGPGERFGTFVLRCINKKGSERRPIGAGFSQYDQELLNQVGTFALGLHMVFTVIRERDDLIDLLTHEVRNPIGGLRTKLAAIYSHESKKMLLMPDAMTPKCGDMKLMIEIINNWVGHVSLLNELMQGKPIKTIRGPNDVRHVVENVAYWLTPQLDDANLSPSDIDYSNVAKNTTVSVDEQQLIQVLYNLILNALKYAKEDTTPRIAVRSQEDGRHVVLEVEDWGVGVGDDIVGRLFERGCRAVYATTHNIQGKGFGLWLARELLKSNGATIELASAREPTVFRLRFEAARQGQQGGRV